MAYEGNSGTAGQVLQSKTAGTSPTFSTATFPSTATGTGTLLRADGTNWAATTSTYPNTNAVSTLLYASSANVMAALPTANNSALVTDGSGVPSLGTSLSNDFTYTSSTAGATRALTVSNTNNSNTASQALLQTTTGGASAGDPFHTFTITGATSFSVGLDNSASDAFVISASTALGTTNVMSVATTGEINYPLQSAFFAFNSATDTNVTGDSTLYTIVCDTEVFDQNADYDNATGTFTAPLTGRYHLNGSCLLTGGTSMTGISLYIATSNRNIRNSFNPGAAAVVTACNPNISHLVDMDAADTAQLKILSVDSGGKVDDVYGEASDVYTAFSGYLEC